eukprot:CCRYP_000073-RA/>CCRYP_000073-RA protein AED:0.18 eAED:0.17 QI:0/0/0/0.75/0.33/0.5/4/0/530
MPSLYPTSPPTASPTMTPSQSSLPSVVKCIGFCFVYTSLDIQLSPSFFPTETLTTLPSSSPTIVEQTVVTPGSFSLSFDICNSLDEEQQMILTSASTTTIQELTCDNQENCSVDITSVCGNSYTKRNRLLSLSGGRKLQDASSWQINYEVTHIFTCQTASCNSPGDKAMVASIVSTISESVSSAFGSGRFAIVLSNKIQSLTSSFESILTTCLMAWGVIGEPVTAVGENASEGTGVYYPDWDGGSGTCLQDDNVPLYMQLNPSTWLYNSLEECCDRYYGAWNKNKCMNKQGSGLWYVDYALGKCVIDCDEVNGPLCGGLAASTEDELFSDPLSCCESKLPWTMKSSCEQLLLWDWKMVRGDIAGSNVCVRDCDQECGDSTCGGIVIDNYIVLHNNVDECCESEYNWIEGDLCSVKSTKASEDNYWWPDKNNNKCIKGSDMSVENLSVQIYNTIEECCADSITWLSKSACVAGSNPSVSKGSGKYFVDWVHATCKQDTGVADNVANSWDPLFDHMNACCEQIWWSDNCIPS